MNVKFYLHSRLIGGLFLVGSRVTRSRNGFFVPSLFV